MDGPFWFIHQPVEWTSGLFLFWVVTNKATLNICVQLLVCACFHFSWVSARSGLAGPSGNLARSGDHAAVKEGSQGSFH